MSCDFPDLADWGGLIPGEVEEVAAERAESLAWSSMLGLVAGRVSLCPVTVRPIVTATGDATMVALARPVGRVTGVKLAGVAFTQYRVEDNVLRRLDGDVWPTGQDLTETVADFEVTYYQGRQPGAAFIWAVGQLAAEFYLAMSDVKGRKCRLPDNVRSVTRQGVSYEMNTGVFDGGLTGIRELDAVIRRYNPNLLGQATVVLSPDSLASRPLRVS